MDEFADYAFDVRGFLHVKSALSAEEIARARAAAVANEPGPGDGAVGAGLEWLAETEPVASRVGDLCLGRLTGGVGGNAGSWRDFTHRLAAPPRLLHGDHDDGSHAPWRPSRSWEDTTGAASAASGGQMRGGGVRRERSVGYFHREGRRVVQSLRAVWALDDASADDILLVPCTHRAQLDAPSALMSGDDDLSSLGEPLYHHPKLAAGDLLIYSPALLHRITPSGGLLVGAEFITSTVVPPAERADPSGFEGDLWEGGVSPELKSILLFDQSPQPSADPDPVPTVLSDGERTWLGDAARARDDHPAVLAPPTAGPAVDPAEAFAWDLNGFRAPPPADPPLAIPPLHRPPRMKGVACCSDPAQRDVGRASRGRQRRHRLPAREHPGQPRPVSPAGRRRRGGARPAGRQHPLARRR
eukprot:COSAG04_NODE_417_length_14700_cov_114.213709_10_plen_414_part_00